MISLSRLLLLSTSRMCVLLLAIVALHSPTRAEQMVIELKVRNPRDARVGDEVPVAVTLRASEIRNATGVEIDFSTAEVSVRRNVRGEAILVRSRTLNPLGGGPHRHNYTLAQDAEELQIAFPHRVEARATTSYEIILEPGKRACLTGDQWITPVGDGDPALTATGPLCRQPHPVPFAWDWNDDGLTDLVYGDILGLIQVAINHGTPGQPYFRGVTLLRSADGELIDFGWYSAPHIVDWDGDGDFDLLSNNRAETAVQWIENQGTDARPAFTQPKTVLLANGEPLTTPAQPCPEVAFEFSTDTKTIVSVVDWDADGDPDLFTGGYVTGLVTYYENVAPAGDNLPQLVSHGFLETDGEPFAVGRGAHPLATDWDKDGKLDLLVGSLSNDPLVSLLRNVGEQGALQFEVSEEAILPETPVTDPAMCNSLAAITLGDFDGDGRDDLVLNNGLCCDRSASGTPRLDRPVLLTAERVGWEAGWSVSLADWDGDGDIDFFQGGSSRVEYWENVGTALRPELVCRGPLQADGEDVFVPRPERSKDDPAYGEAFSNPEVADLNGDGVLDLLIGEASGFVYYCRNRGTRAKPDLEPLVRLKMQDGTDLHVGLPLDAPVEDFSSHAGDRSVPAVADFNGDGLLDLMVADAFSNVTYFENVGTPEEPAFAEGTIALKRSGRATVSAADWDDDGLVDLWVGWGSTGYFVRNEGTRGEPKWAEPEQFEPQFPPAGYFYPEVADWNADGDLDLVVTTSYSYCRYFERSFIESGGAYPTVRIRSYSVR